MNPIKIEGWPFKGVPQAYHCSYGLFAPYFGRVFMGSMKKRVFTDDLAEKLTKPFWEGTNIIKANKIPIVVSSEQLCEYLKENGIGMCQWIHYNSIEDIISDCKLAGKNELAEEIFDFMMDMKEGKYDEEISIIDEELDRMAKGISSYCGGPNAEKYPEHNFHEKMKKIKRY